jgi:hypothetical protein
MAPPGGDGESRDALCAVPTAMPTERSSAIAITSSLRQWSVGTLTLPVDVEPYGPGDSEYTAGQRLLCRVRVNLGSCFIDYVVVDGEFATAPFLHVAGKAGWPVVARLKDNLPELSQAAERRFRSRPPDLEFRDGTDRVQIWDADDFDPWESLQWDTVRVIRYRQHHRNGDIVAASWLTNFSSRQISRRCLYSMAKSRWHIEKTKVSTMPRTAMDSSIFATTTSAACSWYGC